jgi:PKD repeat protein
MTPPVADFTWTPSIPDEGSVIQFIDLSTDLENNIISWSWQFGDGGTSLLREPSHAYGDEGTYQVTLSLLDADGLQNFLTKIIDISNVVPDTYLNIPPIFTLAQGNMTIAIPPIERPENVVSFYNYSSASSHTGFEKAYESKVLLYRDTVNDSLHLFITHGIDNGPSSRSEVSFDLSGIPTGAYASQSDDPSHCWNPPRCVEFSLAYPALEGQWMYAHNTDGGILSGLPLDSPWCITITPQHWFAVNRWVYHFANGNAIDLNMSLPTTICYTPPAAQPGLIDVDEGGLAGLFGFFDDSGWEDIHEVAWAFGDGTSEVAGFSPGAGFYHHDVETVFHRYGDDGVYRACLVVDDGDSGLDFDCLDVVVKNVAPNVDQLALGSVSMGELIAYDAQAIDPGSDDLTFTWSWGDGTPDNVTRYYNDGVWTDPYPSPDGVYPFSVTDAVGHVYESPGDYVITLKVLDDDGGETVRLTSVTVTARDLIPWDVRVNGDSYTTPLTTQLGSDVKISARVYNLGTSDVTDTFYLNLEGLTTIQSTEIQGLGKGSVSAEILTYMWRATALGVHHFNISVDPSNDIIEMDESNNRLHLMLEVKGPDLTPEEIEIDGVEYASPVETGPEEKLTVSFQVANIGEYSTGTPFNIAFYVSTASAQTYYVEEIPGLDIEERSGRIILDWTAPPIAGQYLITIKVDYEDDVLELDEENNNAMIRINVVATSELPLALKPEQNFKPLIALIFTLILVILGGLVGYRKPLDLSVPRGSEEMAGIERKRLRKKSIHEKFTILEENELVTKFSRDRRFTILLLVLPFAVTEAATGIVSLMTGMLRVPGDGTWLTIGLAVNVAVLLAGIVHTLLLSRRGYRVPKEEELGALRESV